MSSGLTRKIVLGGGAALVAIGALAGCSPTTEKDAPSTSSTPASSSATSVAPSEKTVVGGNSFTPSVHVNPGDAVCAKIINGVCSR